MTRRTPELTPRFKTSTPHQWEGLWPPTYDLACNRPTYTAYLQCNRFSNLKRSGPEAETLPLGHRGPSRSPNEETVFLTAVWLGDRTLTLKLDSTEYPPFTRPCTLNQFSSEVFPLVW
ncbi:hypothetical protein AVEN_153636-1 [Araneus ventricosus]|uniref:Uncharacterized protein n=1 Tax=Araneus ventricosus TaxID=182803 RepID=A0A4Y2BRE7_ARAVE|nr:hypothetical protein AVEN_153636-1 [Araneus ventricosus]